MYVELAETTSRLQQAEQQLVDEDNANFITHFAEHRMSSQKLLVNTNLNYQNAGIMTKFFLGLKTISNSRTQNSK